MARTKAAPEVLDAIELEWEPPAREAAPPVREKAPRPPAKRQATASSRNKPQPRSVMRQVRFWLGWCTALVVLLSLCVSVFLLEQFLRKDQRFHLVSPVEVGDDSPSLVVSGVRYTSRQHISRLFEPDYGRSLYSVPLRERREQLMQIDWVKDVRLTRRWPNVVTVEISERTPVAQVALIEADGFAHSALIDADGVLLRQPQASFSLPLLTGVKRSDPQELRRMKVQKMQRLLDEIGSLADKISEINVSELNNIKVVEQEGDHAVTLLLGRDQFRSRLDTFQQYYPDIQRKTPAATLLDLRLPNRINVLPDAAEEGHGG